MPSAMSFSSVPITWTPTSTTTHQMGSFTAQATNDAGQRVTLHGGLYDMDGNGKPDSIQGTFGTEIINDTLTLTDTNGDQQPDLIVLTGPMQQVSGRVQTEGSAVVG